MNRSVKFYTLICIYLEIRLKFYWPYFRPRGLCVAVSHPSVHAVWTLVSATCSMHLNESPLVDVYTMRSDFHRAFILTLAQESGRL